MAELGAIFAAKANLVDRPDLGPGAEGGVLGHRRRGRAVLGPRGRRGLHRRPARRASTPDPVQVIDAHINDERFADAAVDELLALVGGAADRKAGGLGMSAAPGGSSRPPTILEEMLPAFAAVRGGGAARDRQPRPVPGRGLRRRARDPDRATAPTRTLLADDSIECVYIAASQLAARRVDAGRDRGRQARPLREAADPDRRGGEVAVRARRGARRRPDGGLHVPPPSEDEEAARDLRERRDRRAARGAHEIPLQDRRAGDRHPLRPRARRRRAARRRLLLRQHGQLPGRRRARHAGGDREDVGVRHRRAVLGDARVRQRACWRCSTAACTARSTSASRCSGPRAGRWSRCPGTRTSSRSASRSSATARRPMVPTPGPQRLPARDRQRLRGGPRRGRRPRSPPRRP